MTVLVLSECDSDGLKKETLCTVTAARLLSEDVHLVIVGDDCASNMNRVAAVEGITKVIHIGGIPAATLTAENIAAQVLSVVNRNKYTHVLAAATSKGKDVVPRIAACLDVAQISEITSVESHDTFVRPIYAGNAFATIKAFDPIVVLTVRATAFPPAKEVGGTASLEGVDPVNGNWRSRVVSQELTKFERPDLGGARVVVAGGRGVGSAENFKLLEALADKLNAALGASRAAVDSGYVPNDYQVGQTGKIVAPDLYVAVGISGAIQHLAGMKDSKIIVAINKDSDAPIFQIADYGIVGDLFEVVPQLIAALR